MNKSLFVLLLSAASLLNAENIINTTTSVSCETKTIPVGGSFSIKVASNPTTGYSWRCICTPKEYVIVTNKYKSNDDQEKTVGSGGTETFTITATKPGTVECILEYGRPWDPQSYGNIKKYRITFVP